MSEVQQIRQWDEIIPFVTNANQLVSKFHSIKSHFVDTTGLICLIRPRFHIFILILSKNPETSEIVMETSRIMSLADFFSLF